MFGSDDVLADAAAGVRLRELFESPPHALGVDEPVLSDVRGPLRAAVCDGSLERCPHFLRICGLENDEWRNPND
jgi:hypothetical protein